MERRHGWVLATFLQRVAAHVIDTVLLYLPLLGLMVILVVLVFGVLVEEEDVEDVVRLLVIVALGSLVLFAGYAIWWLIALGRGQTPGKQLVGIRVVKDSGEPSGWGYTFLRELVIKALVGGFLSGATGGIYFVVDYLWPLFDRDSQALHDKMVGTLVVQNRR